MNDSCVFNPSYKKSLDFYNRAQRLPSLTTWGKNVESCCRKYHNKEIAELGCISDMWKIRTKPLCEYIMSVYTHKENLILNWIVMHNSL
jgi:hypothetical protein